MMNEDVVIRRFENLKIKYLIIYSFKQRNEESSLLKDQFKHLIRNDALNQLRKRTINQYRIITRNAER
jgi:hypothetical protein